MSGKTDILARLRAYADASGNLDLIHGFGTPGGHIVLRGETVDTGVAYAIPGYSDGLATAMGGSLDSGGGVETKFRNDAGEALGPGIAIALSFTHNLCVEKCDALAVEDAERFLGITTHTGLIAPGELIEFKTNGYVRMLFVEGGVEPHRGYAVFLSTTPGLVQVLPPTLPGEARFVLGRIVDVSTYAEDNMCGVMLWREAITEVPFPP